jgi:hypothetical protein
MEKKYEDMNVTELKACVYDVLVQREQSELLLRQLNQLIEQKSKTEKKGI